MDFITNISKAETKERRANESFEHLQKMFEDISQNKEITLEQFQKLVKSKNPFFVERMFKIFDVDKSNTISKQEFVSAMKEIIGKAPEEKLKFLFQTYDLDGDGFVSPDELRHVIKCCMEENGLLFSDDELDELTRVLFEDADSDGGGSISFNELKNLLHRHPGLIENLSMSIERWLLPPPPSMLKKTQKSKSMPNKFTWTHVKNNKVSVIFFTLFIAINIILFATRAYAFRNSGIYMLIARACGQCLNFNCSFILVLMLRHSISCIRSYGFSEYLPLDQHIYYHKMTGWFIFVYSIIHTIAHILNFREISKVTSISLAELLFTRASQIGWVAGTACITGWIILISLILMIFSSLPFMRRSGYFEIFYYCHLLYIIFWLGLIIHGPVFWYWFIVPGVIFIIEEIFRVKKRFGTHGHTYVEKGILLPSRVIHLVIKRPSTFLYQPGDWMFIQIPAIANAEWHPFTISSAPEMEGSIWLHIRAVGEWTKRLYDHFVEQEKLLQLQNKEVYSASRGYANPALNIEGPNEIGIRCDPYNMKKAFFRMSKLMYMPTAENPKECLPSPIILGQSTPKIYPISTPVLQEYKRQYTLSPLFGGHVNLEDSFNDKKNESFLVPKPLYFSPMPSPMPSPISKDFLKVNDRRIRDQGNDVNSNSLEVYEKPIELELIKSVKKDQSRRYTLADGSFKHNESGSSDSSIVTPQVRRYSDIGGKMLIPRQQSKVFMFPKPEDFCSNTKRINTEKDIEAALDSPGITTINFTQLTFDVPVTGCDKLRPPEKISINKSETLDTILSGRVLQLPSPLHIYLDGPYGSPSSHIFHTEHAILVATGIGVTPFASILQSIMFRYLESRKSCPKCLNTWVDPIPATSMKLKKVDFVWINRDQKSFEWFVNLLSELEITQAQLEEAERFLDIHMYITSALDKTDMKSVGLQLALDLMHEKDKRDLITGLKTRTKPGRPKWETLFKDFESQNKGRITVFYCGPPELGRLLHTHCNKFGFAFRKENF